MSSIFTLEGPSLHFPPRILTTRPLSGVSDGQINLLLGLGFAAAGLWAWDHFASKKHGKSFAGARSRRRRRR